jgi:hypothetical protein
VPTATTPIAAAGSASAPFPPLLLEDALESGVNLGAAVVAQDMTPTPSRGTQQEVDAGQVRHLVRPGAFFGCSYLLSRR